MTSRQQQDIIDPDDFCRACYGRGGEYETTERSTRMFVACRLCRGSGRRTVRLDIAVAK